MKIAITGTADNLDAPISPIFGRCECFLFVDTDTLAYEAVPNPARNARGGAGVQSAQMVIRQGADALVSGNVGPNAMQVLSAANLPVYTSTAQSARDVVAAFNAGELEAVSGATVSSDYGKGLGVSGGSVGTGGGPASGGGRAGGGGRGMGGGRGRGGAGGGGRGR